MDWLLAHLPAVAVGVLLGLALAVAIQVTHPCP